MHKTKCKGCGAEIIFIDYKNKKHPVNATPRKVFVKLNTEYDSNFPDGKFDFGYVLTEGFESHFATCPKAKDFRKKEQE